MRTGHISPVEIIQLPLNCHKAIIDALILLTASFPGALIAFLAQNTVTCMTRDVARGWKTNGKRGAPGRKCKKHGGRIYALSPIQPLFEGINENERFSVCSLPICIGRSMKRI